MSLSKRQDRKHKVRRFLRGFKSLGMLALLLVVVSIALSPPYLDVLTYRECAIWGGFCVLIAFIDEHGRQS